MSPSARYPTVFVTSATGLQGNALCHQLRGIGWNVHGTTRDPHSPTAHSLRSMGVQLTTGGWDDEGALRTALAGCDMLYLCLMIMPGFDFAQPPLWARRIARIAVDAGVRHAVASTTLGVCLLEEGRSPPTPPGPIFTQYFQSHRGVEQAIEDGGFNYWTILRPAFFMANFLEPKIHAFGITELRDKGSWTTSMLPQSRLALIDHVDIARSAVAAFRDPSTFHGLHLVLAQDELPVQEVLDQLSEAIGQGRDFRALYTLDEEIKRAQEEGSWTFFYSDACVRYMSDYTNKGKLENLVGGLNTFKQFLAREAYAVRKTYVG
ncbi:NmrA family protein [Annulohypoxylon bovei var. microspora]|nr:NmrA family protein [Annulohypoxylon bovei var. microspora]